MCKILDIRNFNGEIIQGESMSAHTSYKIGGKAKYYIIVNDITSLKNTLTFLKNNNIDYFILGGGSNLLISDEGYDGAIIRLEGDFRSIEFDSLSKNYKVGAGLSLAKLVNTTKANFHKGFEFAIGTPGTVGGAIKMNAGTQDHWISSQLLECEILDENNDVVSKSVDEIEWGYRYSSIADSEIVLSAVFNVEVLTNKEEKDCLINKMNNRLTFRKEHQPLNHPSCGSVFKNPPGNSAGRLIDSLGYKSRQFGGAMVSSKHANFIVNINNAKAHDVIFLIKDIQKKVYDKYSVKLIPEVKFLGFNESCSLF